jgi:hypothetical protein
MVFCKLQERYNFPLYVSFLQLNYVFKNLNYFLKLQKLLVQIFNMEHIGTIEIMYCSKPVLLNTK